MVLLYLAFGTGVQAQSVQLPPLFKSQWFDSNGRPLANGCIFTYISGTNTPQATFTDFTGGTPNPNPIILDGSGREPLGTDIWLGPNAYRIKLVSQGGVNCVTGVQIFQEDGISSSFATVLASNNTFTGVQTFNGPAVFNSSVTMNAGFTSNGPSILNAGGTFSGTFSGTPAFSGMPTFESGFSVNGNATFNGEIISTVPTGNPPFLVSSTTEVPGLNVALLEGFNWENPGTIGSTTPNSGLFTSLAAATFTVGGGATITSIQGTNTELLSSGTIASGAGHGICTDALGGATTTGCATSGFTQIQAVKALTNCTVSSGSTYDACNDTISWPTAFADTGYSASCTGVQPSVNVGSPSTNQAITLTISSYSTTSITVITQSQRSANAHYNEIHCIGVHP